MKSEEKTVHEGFGIEFDLVKEVGNEENMGTSYGNMREDDDKKQVKWVYMKWQ